MARRITGGLVGSSKLVGSIQISPEAELSTAADKDITFSPGAGAQVVSTSDIQLNEQRDLRFADADSSNYVGFQAPAVIPTNITWTLPSADGSADQAITTNGSGTLSFTNVRAVVSDQTVSATILYPLLNSETSGAVLTPNVSSTKLSYQPSTGTLFNANHTGSDAPGTNLILRSTTNATKGQVFVDETTEAGSTTTGALRVAGGAGIAGRVYAASFYGDGANLTNVPSRGRLLSVNIYTTQNGQWNSVSSGGTSGTWSRPAGCTNVLVYVTGGGGGCRHVNNAYRGAGGGGGATAIRYLDVTNTSSVSVAVGGGGTHNYGGRGNTGGTSSFGPFVTATGGQGGITDNPYEGGPGGNAAGGDVNLPGGGGTMSHGSNREGGGGMSFWFKAGSHHMNQNSNIELMHGQWGSGGSSGYYSSVNAGQGNGGGGCVIVYNYS